MIVDRPSMRILSAAVRLYDIMEAGVTGAMRCVRRPSLR